MDSDTPWPNPLQFGDEWQDDQVLLSVGSELLGWELLVNGGVKTLQVMTMDQQVKALRCLLTVCSAIEIALMNTSVKEGEE